MIKNKYALRKSPNSNGGFASVVPYSAETIDLALRYQLEHMHEL